MLSSLTGAFSDANHGLNHSQFSGGLLRAGRAG